MKLTEFKTNRECTFTELKCKLNIASPIVSVEGRLLAKGIDSFALVTKNGEYSFKFKDDSDARHILDYMKQNGYNLAYANPVKNGSVDFDLHVTFFYTAKIDKRTNVILSEKVKETLKRKHLVSNKPEEFESSIIENFVLFDGNSNCYAYTSGNYQFEDYKENDNKEAEALDLIEENIELDDDDVADNIPIVEEAVQEVDGKKLKIFGRDYSLCVKRKTMGEDEFLYAEKVDTINVNIPNLALNVGELSFKDGDRYLSEKYRKELSNSKGYIDIWDQYAKLEGDYLLEKTRKVGCFGINRKNISITEGGVSIRPVGLSNEALSLITNGDSILFTETPPIYIQEDNMTWVQFKEYFMTLSTMMLPKKMGVSKRIKRVDKDGYIILEIGDDETIPEGIASLDINGDMKQILRREIARDRIINAESANRALGRIIEGRASDIFVDVREVKKNNPLSPFVKEKIFSHDPTPTQIKAIDIALNTPDIAIIQGPPGTGKTTVITAIIERLNELADKRRDVKGQVLVTSFQHDAVRNVIERLSINSLPTIKFGTQGDNDVSMDKALEKWCDDYKNRLIARNPSMNRTIEQKKLTSLRDLYMLVPSDTNAIRFLKYAQEICLDNEVNEEIDFLIDDIQLTEESTGSDLINKIRRLRTTEKGFMDDGPENADVLLEAIEGITNRTVDENKHIIDVLETAADFSGSEVSINFLKQIEDVKKLLLEKCMPKQNYRIEIAREDVLEIYNRIISAIHNPKNEEEEILYNLLSELDGNMSGILDSIVGYNFVFAATTQQSEGYEIKYAKNATGADEHPIYDTIIIDEAARVNPGDLMIPMAQGKRRIILVGDHRQLPHIYNEEIFESMQVTGSSVDKDVVKVSMFEYLMNKSKELYAQDRIERFITLDAQYRMHPILGRFISEQFYEKYDEGFKSPLSAENFDQKLFKKPIAWYDLKNSSGNEEKFGTSRIRHCEAELIADKVKEFIESGNGVDKNGKKLKYGIITFYSAQVKEIQKKLGVYADQVRVGTVDAFQGMEFDVIFLSVVRSHKKAPEVNYDLLNKDLSNLDVDSEEYKTCKEYIDQLGMKNYGFLTSENRLCVALSRQKKVLIVVGDSNIFVGTEWDAIAEKCVPTMRALYKLAEKEGVIIDG